MAIVMKHFWEQSELTIITSSCSCNGGFTVSLLRHLRDHVQEYILDVGFSRKKASNATLRCCAECCLKTSDTLVKIWF